MKRSGRIFIVVLCALFVSVSAYAVPITVDLVQNADYINADYVKGTPYGSGTLTFQSSGTSFTGSLSVSGMTANTTYQMKLEGQPGDPVDEPYYANAVIGSIGRWWVIDSTKDWGGYSITDNQVAAEREAGKTVLGYLLFDSFTTNAEGEARLDFYLDSSYHTAGVPQPGRPAPGSVVMPSGGYFASFIITEDSAPWGTPLLCRNIQFEVSEAAPVPEPATLVLLGTGILGLAGFRKKVKR